MPMTSTALSRVYLAGGLCGLTGVVCYVVVITVSMGVVPTFLLAILWPIGSIMFCYSLYRLIASEIDSALNQVSFIMAALAFVIVAQMISVQLAVNVGSEEILRSASNEESGKLIRRMVRLVDMGLDVAWDVFIGTALVLVAIPRRHNSHLGIWWSIPAAILGVLLLVLNILTFPWPPDSRNLFDVGPFVGVYIFALSGRILNLGLRGWKSASVRLP